MKAVVMAGGEGSRLRPLTINRPKPMVPLVDRPVVAHTFELLKIHGFTDIIVTVQYLANIIQDYFEDGSAFGLNITYAVEESPLGTAGSVKNAQAALDEPFLVISGDALTDIDLGSVVRAHHDHDAMVTITLKRSESPLDYGVVITDEHGRIRQFLEKPSWGELFSDTVNTGIYVVNPRVFEYIEDGKSVDWSKDVFSALLRDGHLLYGHIAEGYWTDIGTLDAYMRATADYLQGRVKLPRYGSPIGGDIWVGGEVEIAPDARLYGPVYLGHGVKIKGGVTINGPTVIRDYTIVDTQARIDRSIVWRNSYIGERSELRGAIVTRQSNIKNRAVLLEGAVVGDYTVVNSGAMINSGVKIWPSKEIDENATIKDSIIWGSQGRRVLFGRYGITGLVNIDITPEFCAKLGAAYGGTLPKGATVLINRDAHYTPRMLKRAIISGIPSAGVNVADVSTMPIPVARYMVAAIGAAGAVHVRLSPFDNRVVDIKFFDAQGLDISRGTERTIEHFFFREDYRRVYLDEIGRIDYQDGVEDRYINGFFESLRKEAMDAIAGHFNIVVDYANANASTIPSTVLRRLQCDVVELNANLDEGRIFQTAQQFEEGMRQLAAIVPVLHAELGVRLDPGGEKTFIVDDRGRTLTDLQKLAVMIDLSMRCRGGGTVAVPVDVPRAFEEIARRYGGEIVRTPANLSSLMRIAASNDTYLLLGDAAGNLIFPSFYPIADGLFATVKLMELLALQNVRLSEIVDSLPPYHVISRRVLCRWEDKGRVMRLLNERFADRQIDQIDGIQIDLGDEWVLVLPDIEGPFFNVIAEGTSDERAAQLADEHAELVARLQ